MKTIKHILRIIHIIIVVHHPTPAKIYNFYEITKTKTKTKTKTRIPVLRRKTSTHNTFLTPPITQNPKPKTEKRPTPTPRPHAPKKTLHSPAELRNDPTTD